MFTSSVTFRIKKNNPKIIFLPYNRSLLRFERAMFPNSETVWHSVKISRFIYLNSNFAASHTERFISTQQTRTRRVRTRCSIFAQFSNSHFLLETESRRANPFRIANRMDRRNGQASATAFTKQFGSMRVGGLDS